jgi:tetratricopeptide (TPR) repeat protein
MEQCSDNERNSQIMGHAFCGSVLRRSRRFRQPAAAGHNRTRRLSVAISAQNIGVFQSASLVVSRVLSVPTAAPCQILSSAGFMSGAEAVAAVVRGARAPPQPAPLPVPHAAHPPSTLPITAAPSASARIEQLMCEANLLRSRNKISDAIALFAEVLALDAHHLEALNTLGVCLKQAGDAAGATEAYRRVLLVDALNWCALNNLGIILKEQGRTAEALVAYRAAIASGPPDCVARANIATLLTDIGTQLKLAGDAHRAMASYREAVAFHAGHAPAHFSIGMLHSEQQQFDSALDCYQRALELCPQYVEALCNCGVIFKNRGMLEAAIQHYEVSGAQHKSLL